MRWTSGVLIVVGVVVGIVGVVMDYQSEFWADNSFQLNLTTAFVGFCIGVPIALFLLSAINGQREQNVRVDSANELTRRAWSEFGNLGLLYLDGDRSRRIDALVSNIAAHAQQILNEMIAYIEKVPRQIDPVGHYPQAGMPREVGTDPSGYELLKKRLLAHAELLDADIKALVRELGPEDVARIKWSKLCSEWQFLNQFVRPRRYELGLEWITEVTESTLHHFVVPESQPLSGVYTYLVPQEVSRTVRHMENLPNALRDAAAVDEATMMSDYNPSGNGVLSSVPLSNFVQSWEICRDVCDEIRSAIEVTSSYQAGVWDLGIKEDDLAG
ncbi:hypothetical protein [Rhodococcus pyridinivorans]|uniref:hypothetical protein n=1 Tax=Rhodococcus pyridinivorans TaxID=103816 RepID=UPI003AAC1B08